jgi:hypothetical protein
MAARSRGLRYAVQMTRDRIIEVVGVAVLALSIAALVIIIWFLVMAN